MTTFLDLLEAYHHWCVRGDRSRLEGCQGWLATLTTAPNEDVGWHRLGTEATDWLAPSPAEWRPHWRMLSPRQMSLTVEALEYLEMHARAPLPPPSTHPLKRSCHRRNDRSDHRPRHRLHDGSDHRLRWATSRRIGV